MSNVTRQHWKSLKAAFSEVAGGNPRSTPAACACMDETRLKDLDRFSDCVSIHTLNGEAIYVSSKALYTFCKPVSELAGDGFRRMLEQSGFEGFVEKLQACHREAKDLESEFQLETRQINTGLSLRFTPLESCEKDKCNQTVMVFSRQSEIETVQIPQEIVPSPQLTELPDLVQSCLTEYSSGLGTSTVFKLTCEQEVLPHVNVDPALLQRLILNVLEAAHPARTGCRNLEVQMQRSARQIKLRLLNKSGVTADPYAQGHDAEMDGAVHKIGPLSRALGVKVRYGDSDTPELLGELQVPINAGVALPDPENFAGELVRIHKPANSNANPIPKMQSTG